MSKEQSKITNPLPTLIEKHGWDIVEVLPQDGTFRTYTRIEKNGKIALYMDCGPLEGVPLVTRLSEFIKIGDWLRGLGLRTPEVYEVAPDQNSAIIEDFGDVSLKMAMEQGMDRLKLYSTCMEILEIMQAQDCPLDIPHYKNSFMRKARQRFADWYVPVVLRRPNPDDFVDDYHDMWNRVEAQLEPYRETFMHVDFHVENLMYLGGEGTNSIGIIDFQEGQIGPESYDLVNLMEDMRADVPPEIQAALTAGKDENYLGWYRILGTQFHTRLLGQCLRWAIAEDKTGYMKFYPRLLRNTLATLDHPVLTPFRDWLQREKIPLIDPRDLDWQGAAKYISEDAI